MKKSRWLVTARGKVFAMCGEKCTQADALYCARLIWPDASVA
jgi:hypothetical protein